MTGRPAGDCGVRILALPAFQNRAANPYNFLLYTAMIRLGAQVDEVSALSLVRAKSVVLHIHWPEYFFGHHDIAVATLKSAMTAVVIHALKFRQVRILWTVHNLDGHDRRHPRLETFMWRWFVKQVDGYITMSRGGQRIALERFPELERIPGFVIPHGDYRGEYPDTVTRQEARALLDIPQSAKVVLFIGTIRPYKNLLTLVTAFRRNNDQTWRLLIAGKPACAEIGSALTAAAGGDHRIRLDLGRVPDDQMQWYLRAADLVVFPYRDILNSGSALLALSFDRPILVPRIGALVDLHERAGDDWVGFYEGDLTEERLTSAMDWATSSDRNSIRLRTMLDWSSIASETIRACELLLQDSQYRAPAVNHFL